MPQKLKARKGNCQLVQCLVTADQTRARYSITYLYTFTNVAMITTTAANTNQGKSCYKVVRNISLQYNYAKAQRNKLLTTFEPICDYSPNRILIQMTAM